MLFALMVVFVEMNGCRIWKWIIICQNNNNNEEDETKKARWLHLDLLKRRKKSLSHLTCCNVSRFDGLQRSLSLFQSWSGRFQFLLSFRFIYLRVELTTWRMTSALLHAVRRHTNAFCLCILLLLTNLPNRVVAQQVVSDVIRFVNTKRYHKITTHLNRLWFASDRRLIIAAVVEHEHPRWAELV